jgi:hypothetical protein
MKHIIVLLIAILVTIIPNSILYSQTTSNTQKGPTLGETIKFSRAGHLNSLDNMTYEIIISWRTNSSDIVAINIYRKERNDGVYNLFERVPFENGGQKFFIRPGRSYQYVLRTIDRHLKESEYSEALTITSGWNRVS